MPFADMVGKIENLKKGTGLIAELKAYETVFRNSNPLVTQEGEYAYLVGGYGTPIDSTQDSSAYQTFGQVTKIYEPSVIRLITEAKPTSIDWDNILV
ncbi:hypothetical protein [Roseivirga pacifica]|uniref:hypothetical protein n=1 Tax=Roseivirga pacifica TaxID=1267423 RepID=UPI002094F53F|nr:hypothetical protein [Roseivirga pacifica]MCO6357260.1 hypothetical protein [Roseivirga pacifica]MCO6368026.1 hypothetical protein [Roseivirga pacifica]MCO6369492.1 hypothetical protein [Roseivirga pacifica]MCO6373346.1 hypothetical protein [Roseivirga pacifica]MCO6377397.1 hypothetical protein [Roseivirga pacifica]